jgi:hypothetical protein
VRRPRPRPILPETHKENIKDDIVIEVPEEEEEEGSIASRAKLALEEIQDSFGRTMLTRKLYTLNASNLCRRIKEENLKAILAKHSLLEDWASSKCTMRGYVLHLKTEHRKIDG